MNKILRPVGAVAVAVISSLSLAGSASADTTFDSGMVTVTGATKAVRLAIGNVAVLSVSKVSDPGVQVRITEQDGSTPVAVVTHGAGQNGCSAADNPASGTLNRTITIQGAPSATVYLKAQYTVTAPDGSSSTVVVEPLGAGITVIGTNLLFAIPVPVDVCVS